MSGRTLIGTLDLEFNPFEDDYLAEIFEAIAVAWARMKHPKRNEIEDQITNRLAGRLMNDPHFTDLPYDIITQHSLLGLNGDCLGRLDLRFKYRCSHRDYFAFESKRLHVTYPGGSYSTEYPTYAGEEGMMAFVDGQYSTGLAAGGMLGYVMDGDVQNALKGLAARIEARTGPLKLLASSKLSSSSLAFSIVKGVAGTHLGETGHDLKSHQLRLFHLLLPVLHS